MKKMKRILAIIVGIWLCLPAWSGWAGSWKADFNDGKLDGWREVFRGGGLFLRAKWNVVQGVVKGRLPPRMFQGLPSPAHALLLAPVAIQGDDFEVEHTIKNPGIGKAGTVVTHGDKNYVFNLHESGAVDYRMLILSERSISHSIRQIKFSDPNIIAGQTTIIKVKFQKPRFEVYFSGNKIFEFEDVDFQPEAVGFYLFEFDGITKAEGFFDDFIISGQAIPDDPFAVKPKPKLTDDLIIQLKDPKAEVRRNAAKALGEIGEAKAVEPLMAALKDPDFLVRENAVIALGEIGDVKAVEPLVAAVKDGLVRPYATTIALGQIGDKRGLEE